MKTNVALFASGLMMIAMKLGIDLTLEQAVGLLAQQQLYVELEEGGKFPDDAIDVSHIQEAIEQYLAQPKARLQ